jgi:hypothetical protein
MADGPFLTFSKNLVGKKLWSSGLFSLPEAVNIFKEMRGVLKVEPRFREKWVKT